MLKVSENFIIATKTNSLLCYLIIEVSNVKPLLIKKLRFIGIEFQVSREVSCIYGSLAKPKKDTKSS